MTLNISALSEAYRAGEHTPSDVVSGVYRSIAEQGERPVWITLVRREDALARARLLEEDPQALALPLYGIPFAVKDNIDVAGLPTTVGCPEFAYEPERSATVVEHLLAAGAILIGKTNLDQFATGLVGVRSPYGACSSIYDERYISGGSSSGSAVAVARGLVAFSLGTDTAGSGRVPAAFNHLVGLKPTRGVLSTAGVFPACRTLDCVSIFTALAEDARAVWKVLKGNAREPRAGEDAAPWLASDTFLFGVPPASQLEFFGDTEARQLFEQALERLQALGGEPVEIDLTPFRDAAELLYSGPWVAERLAAVGRFVETGADAIHPVVRKILQGGAKYTAVDAFKSAYRLQELREQSDAQWKRMDVLVLPTTGTIYTHQEIQADPVQLNTNLGYYTNFVNLLDLAAIAVPAGFRPNSLPFGVSFIGPAFSDSALLELAAQFQHMAPAAASVAPGCVSVAVVGAHLTGQPLNQELTARGARLTKTCRTAPGYRLYALKNTTPSKPGLVREEAYFGQGIEVEVWAMPEHEFGGFVAAIPPPLGIGSALLDDGSTVKCFICEPYAVAGSAEITSYGGWRKYLASMAR